MNHNNGHGPTGYGILDVMNRNYEKNTGRCCWLSPFGWLEIVWNHGGLISLQRKPSEKALSCSHPHGLGEKTIQQLSQYVAGKRTSFDLPLAPQGTDFQKRVWKELCAIPYGQVRCYQDIARAIGNPGAARAVGMANHHNPIAIVIPCHRVIGKNGDLVGYAGGIAMKKKLLHLEKAIDG